MAFLPQGSSAQVAITAGQSIAVGAVRGGTANVTFPVGYPKGPSSTVNNTTAVYGPFTTATTVTVYASQGTAEYVTGISPVCTDGPVALATDPLTGRITALVSGTSSIPIGNYLQSTMPVGLPPSGSVGNNGALTLGTALDAIYSGGVWLYFPAGALFSGSAAGVYYTVMSSTTVGTIYADVLGSNTSKPSSPTPIVATGPGAYTTPTGSNITLISTAIAAGAFGSFGGFQGTIVNANNTTAGGKLVRMLLNGVTVGGATVSTTSPNSQNIVFQNTGAVAENYVFFQNFTTSGVGQASSITAINTSLDMTLVVAANLVVATDWAIVRTAIAAPLGNV